MGSRHRAGGTGHAVGLAGLQRAADALRLLLVERAAPGRDTTRPCRRDRRARPACAGWPARRRGRSAGAPRSTWRRPRSSPRRSARASRRPGPTCSRSGWRCWARSRSRPGGRRSPAGAGVGPPASPAAGGSAACSGRRRLVRPRSRALGCRRRRQCRRPAAWALVEPGSSFSGWAGTVLGARRLKTSLSWLGGTEPAGILGFTRDGVAGAWTTSGSSPRPPAFTSWLCAHHTTEPKLAMAAIETMTVRIWPRRRLTRMSRESRGGGGMESGSCATGLAGGSSRTDATDSFGR